MYRVARPPGLLAVCCLSCRCSPIKACFRSPYFLRVMSESCPRGFPGSPRGFPEDSTGFPEVPRVFPKVPRDSPSFTEVSQGFPRFPKVPQGFLVGWLVGPSASWLVPGIACVSRTSWLVVWLVGPLASWLGPGIWVCFAHPRGFLEVLGSLTSGLLLICFQYAFR
jgi:hypothetical protein